MMAKIDKIILKFLINKDDNRVVFVQSGCDFINVLFSLLTLPMGTILRITERKLDIGCLDNLHESVVKLGIQHLQTPECYDMLIFPRSAYQRQCRNLKVKIDDSKPAKYFKCSGKDGDSCTYDTLSINRRRTCLCGEGMSKEVYVVGGSDGFVEEFSCFIITDDLKVKVVTSSAATLSLLKEIGIADKTKLEIQTMEIGKNEVLCLLVRSFTSNEPLTDVFYGKDQASNSAKLKTREVIEYPKPDGLSKKISLKLMVRKSSNTVLYAEAGADFVDFLLSILTFPLGSVIKLLGGNSSLECIDNLYKSIDDPSVYDKIISDEIIDMFLDPKHPQHYKCESQLLSIEEEGPFISLTPPCTGILQSDFFEFPQDQARVALKTINPKFRRGQTESGGGFTKEMTYIVTDDLNIKPFSPIQAVSVLNELEVPVHDVQERNVEAGEEEGLELLRASLISKTVLNDVFTSK